MFKTFIKTRQIDLTYSINSFIFTLSKLPIFNDLITQDAYNGKILKIFLGIITSISKILFGLLWKFIYLLFLIVIVNEVLKTNKIDSFIHMYFFIRILGMFLNEKRLHPTKRNYISIVLFNTDASKYYKTELITKIIKDILINSVLLSIIMTSINANKIYVIVLVILDICTTVIGEFINIIYYRKKEYTLSSNKIPYLLIIILTISLTILPLINIYIEKRVITTIVILLIIPTILSLIYLFKVKDYKLMFKKICIETNALESKNETDYLYQTKLNVKEKDKIINSNELKNKKGYDLFNTIFFKRHREIILRSAKMFAIIIFIIYLVLTLLVINNRNPVISDTISTILKYKLSFFIIIMYFINRGAILTQAMFYNCDHAMLTYNFFREPKVIKELFKKRLLTLVKVNMIPASIIAIGNIILIVLTTNSYTYLSLITTFLYIISLSVFFSVHYLTIYYLLQPYNKNMQIKKFSYTLVSFLTYYISYSLKDLVLLSNVLSIIVIAFVIAYVLVSLTLIYKISPKTFKLN